jgi:hypothetical protein
MASDLLSIGDATEAGGCKNWKLEQLSPFLVPGLAGKVVLEPPQWVNHRPSEPEEWSLIPMF